MKLQESEGVREDGFYKRSQLTQRNNGEAYCFVNQEIDCRRDVVGDIRQTRLYFILRWARGWFTITADIAGQKPATVHGIGTTYGKLRHMPNYILFYITLS